MRRLSTERLTLRPVTAADAPFLLALLNEPGFLANIGDRGVRSVADAESYLRTAAIFAYGPHGLGYNIVQDAAGAPVGIAGLVKRDTLPHPDLGYAISAAHAGRGFATEAATAVLAHARDALRLAPVLAITTLGNTASRRVLERVGFRLDRVGGLDGLSPETCLYRA